MREITLEMIEELRLRLNEVVMEEENLQHPRVLALSQELDEFLNRFIKSEKKILVCSA